MALLLKAAKRREGESMDQKKLRAAEHVLKQIAMREGRPVTEIRKEIYEAMLAGLSSQDAKVQAYWRRIPCKGDVPRPEELIMFLAEEAKKK